jgi:hypothetical protein
MLRGKYLRRGAHGSLTSTSTLSATWSPVLFWSGAQADQRTSIPLSSEDTYAPDTIEILAKSGIDFARHRTQGINPNDFAEVLITSGLVLFEDITWIGYHSYVICSFRPSIDY